MALATELVTDQFGTRNIGKFKPMLLCTPAVKGVPTTTTTTVLLSNGSPCIGPQQCLSDSCFDGVCMLVNGQPCDPYVCDGNAAACLTSCVLDANCVTGNYCSAGACVPQLANGTPCGASNQCLSGNCFNGLCAP